MPEKLSRKGSQNEASISIRKSTYFVMLTALLFGILTSLDATSTPASKPKADQVVVLKEQRTLQLLQKGQVLRTYRVALGGTPIGAKQQQGDHKTPEGKYVLDRRNPNSKFYKSIHVSYPSPSDVQQAKALGVDPGGDIMIHGLPNGFGWLGATHRLHDWTDGCIAVTNEEMDEIWNLVADGTSVEIRP